MGARRRRPPPRRRHDRRPRRDHRQPGPGWRLPQTRADPTAVRRIGMEPGHDGAAAALRARRAAALRTGIVDSGMRNRMCAAAGKRWRPLMYAAALGLMLVGTADAATPSSDTPEEVASRVWLWPGRVAPGSERVAAQQAIVERSSDPALPDRIITGVTQPYLVVHRPRRPNGAALLVVPGGSYRRVVLDKEGSALVPAFADAGGVTLFVLRYRLPGDGHALA